MPQLLGKLESPVLLDIQSFWSENQWIESYLVKIPDLYQGKPLLLVLQTDELTGYLKLMGQRGSTLREQTLSLQGTDSRSGMHKLWARAKIKDLMVDPDYLLSICCPCSGRSLALCSDC